MTTNPASTTDLDEEALTDLPGFQRQRTAPGPDPLPDGATTSTPATELTAEELAMGTLGVDGWRPLDEGSWDDAGDAPPAGPRSATATTGSSRASTADWRDFAPVTHMLVGLAGLVVRLARTRRRPGLPEGIWEPDEDDQAAIGDPLARIAARHSPIDGGDSSDVVDALVATVGVAGYAVKNLGAEEQATQRPLDLTGFPDRDA